MNLFDFLGFIMASFLMNIRITAAYNRRKKLRLHVTVLGYLGTVGFRPI